MARIPMVTRTIKMTEVNVLCLEIDTSKAFNKSVLLSRTYKDDKALMKEVEKEVNTDTVKAVHVTSKREYEKLFGMTERDFIKVAKVLTGRSGVEFEVENTAETEAENTPETEAENTVDNDGGNTPQPKNKNKNK